jgi:hypothetical protein
MDEEGNQTSQEPAPQTPEATRGSSPATASDSPGSAPPTSGAQKADPIGPAYAGSLPPAPPRNEWSFPAPTGSGSPAAAKVASPNAGYLVITGGIVVIASQLLPWVTASHLGATRTGNGFDVGGWLWLVILGVFAIARGAALINPSIRYRAGSPWISVILLSIALIWRWAQLNNQINAASGVSSFSISIGIGFWVAVVGLALVAAGALMSSSDN